MWLLFSTAIPPHDSSAMIALQHHQQLLFNIAFHACSVLSMLPTTAIQLCLAFIWLLFTAANGFSSALPSYLCSSSSILPYLHASWILSCGYSSAWQVFHRVVLQCHLASAWFKLKCHCHDSLCWSGPNPFLIKLYEPAWCAGNNGLGLTRQYHYGGLCLF